MWIRTAPGGLLGQYHKSPERDDQLPPRYGDSGEACPPTSDLPETDRTSLAMQAFGKPTATVTDWNTGSTVARELDTSDLTSSAQQGTDGVVTDVKDLPSYLTLIGPAESLDSQLPHCSGLAGNSLVDGEVLGGSDLSAANKSSVYTVVLEREMDQLRRKVTLMERQ
jgi:hypothetical protein